MVYRNQMPTENVSVSLCHTVTHLSNYAFGESEQYISLNVKWASFILENFTKYSHFNSFFQTIIPIECATNFNLNLFFSVCFFLNFPSSRFGIQITSTLSKYHVEILSEHLISCLNAYLQFKISVHQLKINLKTIRCYAN